ncbi:MAG: hypothetical protein K9I71_05930 [Ignavibacteriales bacterium]|nr:hypothetical protein [Ignavibacteriales bacterium]MCF8437163.1 hypothetical protein [Ignavibacteriales bacterium]
MINKNISTQSNKILSNFNQLGQECFDFSEAKLVLPNSSDSALKELLSDMVKRGLLMRLKKGLYYMIPYEKDPETFMPDWHLLAEPLTKGTEHYIGYYSALQIHNLITQPSLKEQIVVSKQLRPSSLIIKDITFQFVYHNKNHFFGSEKLWIDNYTKVLCSDLEKTFLDCLFRPVYAGGIVEISKAIYISRNQINYQKLLEYSIRYQSQAVIKRLGFLLETLSINTHIIEQFQRLKTNSYVILDTELPKTGKMLSRWSIQQNLETETIQSAIYT